MLYDVLVIGSGPSGLTAAIYLARANKKVAVILGPERGGQLMRTTDVENYPGFAHGVQGPVLMDAMHQQAVNVGASMINGSLISFKKIDQEFHIYLDTQEEVRAHAMIVATGANAKWLGIEGDFIGRGVSSCATCDGAFFKNKCVAVIGGGNSAIEEALYLSGIAQKVYLIHRRTAFRGEKILQDRLLKKANIEILWPYETLRFVGQKKLEMLELQNLETFEKKTLQIDGAFIAIGHKPNTEFLNGMLELENDYVKDGPVTKISGLFVAGDVFDNQYRQAVTAAAYGCMAAIEALKFIEE